MPKVSESMTNRERAEMLIDVVSKILRMNGVKLTSKNIKKSTDWVEGRFDMDAPIDDKLLFKLEEKLKGNWTILRRTKTNPAIIKPMKLKPGQRSRQYVAPVRLTQEEMKKRSAAHIEKMRAYRASRGWKEKVPNEQGRYTFGKRRPKADSGSYSSFGAWVSAVRRAGGVPQSELSEPQGAHNRNTGQIIGDWDGSSGSVYRNNPVRQRKGWKIQTESGNGWSDIKSSYGTDFYKTEYFKTKPDAQSELNQLAGIHGDPESYRIVPAATEEDFDLYNPAHRNNPVRQRIAVSLSRSQVRRNPFNDRNLDA